MKKVKITRYLETDKVTIGDLIYSDNVVHLKLTTLELPWLDNKKGVSCIPKGVYKVTTSYSNRFKKHLWEVHNVPNRSGIRIHAANFAYQLEGCIALGMYPADINRDGVMDIAQSVRAMDLAMTIIGSEFELEII
jgi:hypothetical protein